METTYTIKQRVKHSALTFGRILPWLIIIGVIWFLINKPSQDIKVEKGGTATFINKTSRWFTLFTELGVENRKSDLGFYTRVGARVEF